MSIPLLQICAKSVGKVIIANSLFGSVHQLQSCTGWAMQLPNVLVCCSSAAVHDRGPYREEARAPTANAPQAKCDKRVKEGTKLSWFVSCRAKPSLPFTSSPSCKLSMLYVYLLLRQAMQRFQAEFLYRHHICWLHYRSDSPLAFTFTNSWQQHEIQSSTSGITNCTPDVVLLSFPRASLYCPSDSPLSK